MKILLISGFLGAGKTTFIQEMAKKTGRQFVILENEYGEIGIDGKLLGAESESDSAPMDVYELSEGCICCSMKADFTNAILTISSALNPDYLVVEPTGVGSLKNIITHISGILYEHIELMAPVTIVDAHSFYSNLKNQNDIFTDQIRNARTVVLSKIERMDQEDIHALVTSLREINPTADITDRHYSQIEGDFWTRILRLYFDGSVTEEDTSESDMITISLKALKIDSEIQLIYLLDALSAGLFGDIYRAKGFFPIGRNWIHFEYVDGRYAFTGIEPMEESAAVFIGKTLEKAWLMEAFCQWKSKTGIKLTRKSLI